MTGVNLIASAIVHGTPMQCTRALLDEVEGRSSWWYPHLLLRHRPATPHDAVGCVVDAVGSAREHPERWRGTTRWSMRLDGYLPGGEMRWTYLEGHYRGWVIWTFSDAGRGRTRIGVAGEIHPAGWHRVRSLVVDDIFEQMRILEQGFAGLDIYLSTLATATQSTMG